MLDPTYWLLFFSAALALNLAPGPDLLFVLSRSIAQGRRYGIAASCGVCSGALVHVLAAALGLSAILATSALAFGVVKWIGAAYLLYIGWQALRSAGRSFTAVEQAVPSGNGWQIYRQGVLVDLLNPKAAIFFMAFLPQFVRPELGHTTLQLLGLGMLVIVVAILVELALVLAASQATGLLRRRPAIAAWLERGMGSLLVALGLRLALSEKA
jgi:RhtB (resistance to homoserine/threonine) family protein